MGQVERTFHLAREAKQGRLKPWPRAGGTAGLLFFEPSTRTQKSFEVATVRAGLFPVSFNAGAGTSMEKGESVEDSIRNLAAMGHELLIIRAGEGVDMGALANQLPQPVLNAGWGKRGHPTQALLDLFTLQERRELEGARIVFVGDILHSRVVQSHLEVLRVLKVPYAFCGPHAFLPQDDVKRFARLRDAVEWGNVLMFLRYQNERHSSQQNKGSVVTDPQSPFREFFLHDEDLAMLPATTAIMHPGPVNIGQELSQGAYHDPRSMILDQVTHGVWLRQALIHQVLEVSQ